MSVSSVVSGALVNVTNMESFITNPCILAEPYDDSMNAPFAFEYFASDDFTASIIFDISFLLVGFRS